MSDEHSDRPGAYRETGVLAGRESARRARAALLSGEPLAGLPPHARDRAQQLVRTLHAVTAPAPGARPGCEPPPEVLAAYRAGRESAAGRAADATGAPHPVLADGAARRGFGPRSWARSTRLVATGVLSLGMVSGVAVAAGSGALSSPFPAPQKQSPRHEAPAPLGSEGAIATGQPLFSPAPGGTDDPSGAVRESARPRPSVSAGPGEDTGPPGSGRYTDASSATLRGCQDRMRDRRLGVSTLRGLARLAGGSGEVRDFCRRLLGLPDGPYLHLVLPPGSPIPLTPGGGQSGAPGRAAPTSAPPTGYPSHGYGWPPGDQGSGTPSAPSGPTTPPTLGPHSETPDAPATPGDTPTERPSPAPSSSGSSPSQTTPGIPQRPTGGSENKHPTGV